MHDINPLGACGNYICLDNYCALQTENIVAVLVSTS